MSGPGATRQSRRFLAWLGGATLFVVVTAILCVAGWRHWAMHLVPVKHARYVSLSPAITETLVALGVDTELVGVSDYCHYPVQVEKLPHVGSGFTPRYEAIVRLVPTAVFVETVNAANVDSLAQVVRIEAMPWLTLDQVIQSNASIGSDNGAYGHRRAIGLGLRAEASTAS